MAAEEEEEEEDAAEVGEEEEGQSQQQQQGNHSEHHNKWRLVWRWSSLKFRVNQNKNIVQKKPKTNERSIA